MGAEYDFYLDKYMVAEGLNVEVETAKVKMTELRKLEKEKGYETLKSSISVNTLLEAFRIDRKTWYAIYEKHTKGGE